MKTNRLPAAKGFVVCEMILDNPSALNALTPDMARDARIALREWAADDSVAAVVLRGAGERAFCAGGDVRFVRDRICAGDAAAADAYFADEYLLDYALHCFAKPLICRGGGVLMGGGMGIFQGCDVRVVAPNTKAAMPECKIGFFPDVGAAFFMDRFRDAPQTGYYLGLSGRVLDGETALQIGAADVLLADDSYDEMLSALLAAEWNVADKKAAARRAVQTPQTPARTPQNSGFADIRATAEKCWRAAQSGGTDAAIAALPEAEREIAAAASPLSLRVWTEHYLRRRRFPKGENGATSAAARARLREIFARDYVLARNFLRRGDFAEGVRALLTDKDNAPEWRAPADNSAVAAMFEPLADKTEKEFNRRLAELD
ncbi:MAG: enoyl-CoA hydratase/isomerase family protein [Gammaproteobacteria bacterium]